MSQFDKLLQRISALDNNMRFNELRKVLEKYGYEMKGPSSGSSHMTFRKAGRKFFVIRNHNGVVDVLDDIGNDPDTVTFRTDKFSEYAIAYEAVNVNKLILRIVIVSVISLALAIICFVNLIKYKRKERRAKM